MSKLVTFFHVEGSATVRTFVAFFTGAHICCHKGSKVAARFNVLDVVAFFSGSCNTVVHVYGRFICNYRNLDSNRTNKAVWGTTVFQNIFIAGEFCTACLKLSSKFCFVYVQVSADKYTEECFWNISLAAFCNSFGVLVEFCFGKVNCAVVNLVNKSLEEGCRFFTKEFFHVFNAEYIWSCNFFNCLVCFYLWLSFAVERNFRSAGSFFYVCGVITVRAEKECIVTNFRFNHEFF